MEDVFIIDYLRTPIGKFGGALSAVRPDDLAALTIRTLLERNQNIAPEIIEDVVLGCANQAGEDNRNVARFAAMLAGLPVEVPGVTVNRLCASGMQSVIDSFARIRSGMADIMIAGGVESMSRAPYVVPKPASAFDRNLEMVDTTLGWRFINPKFLENYHPYSMGETAENIAERWQIGRAAQDAFAYQSHMKYIAAHKAGKFAGEIIPVAYSTKKKDVVVTEDENVRPDTSLEKLAQLKTAFRDGGTVTAGNASGLNDGAAAMILASAKAVKEYNLKPIARIITATATGVHPDIMGTGPIPATKKVLKQAGLTVADIDLFEINEAYAVQVLCCIDELNLDEQKVNVNGGAVAIGHPLGCSGTRITGHLALELKRRNAKYGLATMCVGVGQGTAIIIENLNN